MFFTEWTVHCNLIVAVFFNRFTFTEGVQKSSRPTDFLRIQNSRVRKEGFTSLRCIRNAASRFECLCATVKFCIVIINHPFRMVCIRREIIYPCVTVCLYTCGIVVCKIADRFTPLFVSNSDKTDKIRISKIQPIIVGIGGYVLPRNFLNTAKLINNV